jgi:hypothetical protein
MLPPTLVALALYFGSGIIAFAAVPLDEVRKSFTIGDKPIPPEIFADFGDAMMSDNRPIVVTIDANSAIESNRYADLIKTNGLWVEQVKPGSGSFNGPETMSYEYRGATANGLLVFLAAYSGGGSGTFYYLHILDAASVRAFDEDGSTYSRLNLTLVRTYILGDRWQGDVQISGNSVRIVTKTSLGGHGASSVTIKARRP